MSAGIHDAGGKSRLPMLPGMTGDAEFSECGRYRLWLSRDWSAYDPAITGPATYALWIGMNPSVAEAEVDDPTIRREVAFTRSLGLTTYVKCNVMDYRSGIMAQIPVRKTGTYAGCADLQTGHICRGGAP